MNFPFDNVVDRFSKKLSFAYLYPYLIIEVFALRPTFPPLKLVVYRNLRALLHNVASALLTYILRAS